MRTPQSEGSIVLAVLLACLGIGVLVAGLAAGIILAQAGREAEVVGSHLAGKAEQGLAAALLQAESEWGPAYLEPEDGVTVTLSAEPDAGARLLRAVAVARSEASTYAISALLERGLDGVDLPRRAVAAASLAWDPARAGPLVSVPSALPSGVTEPTVVTVTQPGVHPPLGEGVVLEVGSGWMLSAVLPLGADSVRTGPSILNVPPGVSVRTLLSTVADAGAGSTPEEPVLLVGSGMAPLDASGCGDLYAVLLGGPGGVDLDGTILHGALFTEGTARTGLLGTVRFDEGLLDWARFTSVLRLRLVPGSREERISGPSG